MSHGSKCAATKQPSQPVPSRAKLGAQCYPVSARIQRQRLRALGIDLGGPCERSGPWSANAHARHCRLAVYPPNRNRKATLAMFVVGFGRATAPGQSLELAIHHAALAIAWRDKRLKHQSRIPRAVLLRAMTLVVTNLPQNHSGRQVRPIPHAARQAAAKGADWSNFNQSSMQSVRGLRTLVKGAPGDPFVSGLSKYSSGSQDPRPLTIAP